VKRSFTFTFSRKVSTAPYENADVFVAEGVEFDDDELGKMSITDYEAQKTAIVKRVRKLVDEQAEEVKG
jgi:hypothetical protein